MKYTIFIFLFFTYSLSAQQVAIATIEQLPNFPQPYEMRDWNKVALGYDSLVFNLQAEGQYLPVIWQDPAGTNYPGHARFGLDSYVGTDAYHSAEAINVLPSIISATLAGIDKSNQNSTNWVVMAEDFFNNREEENVYLNNYVTSSGSDWWYDLMPNIFFYQLYDLYPGQGDFERQFTLVADRWLQAVAVMGGRQTPWAVPQMNYRAWSLSTMTPLTSGVRQPEAAGAIVWILYNAFLKSGQDKYRVGAEWAMEFLNARTQNPAYELQLPYGVYMAARMNAELKTQYDIPKLLNWCFTPVGNVRQWGMTTGNWGGYDCGGLIGEALYDGYGFFMNGLQQAGALVPMVKYDERFARTIGKWVLNNANASRLFYSKYLPDSLQDSENWSKIYDSSSVIAYEAIREFAFFSAVSPYATGDAKGSWANTNLALYGSSHVGIFGGIIDTTNIEGILRLDMNKTDYFNESFPTYLYYNPHQQSEDVIIHLPEGSFDIYESLSSGVISSAVSVSDVITIPADDAVILVLVPSESEYISQLNKTIVNGFVIDYNSGLIIDNFPPRIKSLKAAINILSLSDSVNIYCAAQDPEANPIAYTWSVSSGLIEEIGAGVARWIAPANSGNFTILCIISDNAGGFDSLSIPITVIDNHIPVIDNLFTVSKITSPGGNVLITCLAHDEDGDPLTYSWQDESGDTLGTDSDFNWIAADDPGYYILTCTVQDSSGGSASASIGISVGDLVLNLAFNESAYDSSGFLNSGQISGAQSIFDRNGNANSALLFNGMNDYVLIENNESLNFEDGITVHFWMRSDTIYTNHEMYPISHGNWQNRWKVSINNGIVRWTINSTNSIRDLDSQTATDPNIYYAVSCTYDGSLMKLYLNGELSSSVTHSGRISATSFNLIVGQVLPGDFGHGFKGVLDDIKIYNRALDASEILQLFDIETAIKEDVLIPDQLFLFQNYPNPFNPETQIKFNLERQSFVKLEIFDISGKRVASLFKGTEQAGTHVIKWNANSVASGIYFIRMSVKGKNFVRKIVKIN